MRWKNNAWAVWGPWGLGPGPTRPIG